MLCEQAGKPHEVDRLLAEYPRKKEMFRSRMLERQLIPTEVLALLPELQAYQLAVVTSSGQSEVEPLLRDAGIHGLFRTVVYGGDVKQLKPAPDPYLLAMKKLGARTALVVEDSDAGEASGRAAGLDVLRVKSPLEMPELLRDRIR
jgi:HAD superfamily hydrolase (TIGR01509 family)